MGRILLTSFIFTIFLSGYSQTTECFEIESILVDACGSPEGPNEMVRFRVGPNNLNTVDLSVTWPFNSYQGICQNITTANKVDYMNSTIQACGYFLEPTAGILPANAQVLFVTSVDFDPTAHDYAGLMDTLHVIFQCAGNTQGHFANWVTDCVEANGFRTLSMNFGVDCSQSVTYNRCHLVNQTGGIGGTTAERDGARVDFDADGNPTYANDGCTIPYENMTVNAEFVTSDGIICPEGSVDVAGLTTGNATTFFWESDYGSFNDENAQNTTYTPFAGINDSHYIYFSAVNGCGEEVFDSLLISFDELPEVIISSNNPVSCEPGSIILTASGADTYTWSTGETTAEIAPQTSGEYSVVGTNSCGSDTDGFTVEFGSVPNCEITNPDSIFICEGVSVQLVGVTDGDTFAWSTGSSNLVIEATQSGYYVFVSSNDCGECRDSIWVNVIETNAYFTATPQTGTVPLNVSFNNQSSNYTSSSWLLDGNEFSSSQNPEIVLDEIGEWLITLTVVESTYGCTDTYSMTIVVYEELEVHIPNVFTPNGDEVNDNFGIKTSIPTEGNITIFNRWGNVLMTGNFTTIEDEFTNLWDGHISGQQALEGVYMYTIELSTASKEKETFEGFFQLFR